MYIYAVEVLRGKAEYALYMLEQTNDHFYLLNLASAISALTKSVPPNY